MSSPYRVGAFVPPAGGLPKGAVALSVQEYLDFLDWLAAKEQILSNTPAKIYEPYMIQGELVTVESGDLIIGWGGKYVTS